MTAKRTALASSLVRNVNQRGVLFHYYDHTLYSITERKMSRDDMPQGHSVFYIYILNTFFQFENTFYIIFHLDRYSEESWERSRLGRLRGNTGSQRNDASHLSQLHWAWDSGSDSQLCVVTLLLSELSVHIWKCKETNKEPTGQYSEAVSEEIHILSPPESCTKYERYTRTMRVCSVL